MAKQISQETFDSVVRENMEEFDMPADEAMQEAVTQFEAQGVDLSTIVQNQHIHSGSTGDHPVVMATKTLAAVLDATPMDSDSVVTNCNIIKSECDIDLAYRCLAGKNETYPTLLRALAHTDLTEQRVLILEALCSLCNGQPDLLDQSGRSSILSILSVPELTLLAVRFIRYTCIKHETNRRAYVGDDLIQLLADTLDRCKGEVEVVKEACSALRVLTFDDDIRVPFGKAHDHAKMIVTEAGALGRIMEMCKGYINNKSVLGELFATLACLAVRNEFCQEIMDLGGMELMLDTLEKNMNYMSITRQVLGVLKIIAGNDEVKIAIVNHNGAELIMTAMAKHIRHPAICEMGCGAIATIVLRNPSHCKRVMACGAADIMTQILQIHGTESMVQKQASMAVRNLVARTRDNCDAFLEQGVEALIQKTYATHTSCHDEAKAALRDLGCKVDLKELWTGEGREIDH